MMQRLVGVRRVESLLEQLGREVSCRLGLSIQMKFLLRRLVPNVSRRRTEVDRVVSIYAIRRDYVFPEILVLVIAPHEDEVGLEVVDRLAHLAEARQQRLAMMLGVGRSLVITPFLA